MKFNHNVHSAPTLERLLVVFAGGVHIMYRGRWGDWYTDDRVKVQKYPDCWAKLPTVDEAMVR